MIALFGGCTVNMLVCHVFRCRIDTDKNGSISGDELQQALANGKFLKYFRNLVI